MKIRREVLRLFRRSTHTHTLPSRVWPANEVKMKMTRNDGEMSMKMR